MEVYADSSFLASLLRKDSNGAVAQRYMARHTHHLPFNPLHRLEVRNAIRLNVRRGEMDVEERKTALEQLEADLRDGLLVHQAINWTDALRRAEALSHRHTEVLGARAADILHVAIALESDTRRFLSFDAIQRQLAQAAGLEVRP